MLKGRATFYLDGKTVEAGSNTSLYCPPNAEHGISNAKVETVEVNYFLKIIFQ
ncbi:cupin domain-containing protein [Epilithonimonas caeni]|uniref:cupin domain-containing protein n=1 Tax=Epilithonimonas caeni TaxID=365343 RepID=UPI002934D132|nr:cupin domain-containing protein [Epilithonimonas caeni]